MNPLVVSIKTSEEKEVRWGSHTDCGVVFFDEARSYQTHSHSRFAHPSFPEDMYFDDIVLHCPLIHNSHWMLYVGAELLFSVGACSDLIGFVGVQCKGVVNVANET
jgi:hypothetical protein